MAVTPVLESKDQPLPASLEEASSNCGLASPSPCRFFGILFPEDRTWDLLVTGYPNNRGATLPRDRWTLF